MSLAGVVCLATALVWCPAAAAQSTAEAPNPIASAPNPVVASPQSRLKIPAAVWAAGVVSDQITTYQFASRYRDLMHEENVLINALDRHPVWLVAAGSAIDATSGWLVYRFLGKKHPRLATIAFYGAAAYRSYLASHNLRMMEKARQIRVNNP